MCLHINSAKEYIIQCNCSNKSFNPLNRISVTSHLNHELPDFAFDTLVQNVSGFPIHLPFYEILHQINNYFHCFFFIEALPFFQFHHIVIIVNAIASVQ